MKKLSLSLALLSALALSLSAACSDPVGDAPRATVEKTPAAATTPTTTTPEAPATTPPAGATRYTFSSESGSSVGFVGAKVTGKHEGGFQKVKGTIDVPGTDVEKAVVDVEIDMASITSDNEKLTGHLKSPDFFDVEKNPTARFKSAAITKTGDGAYTVSGDLTLRGVTRRISFPAKIETSADGATAKADFGINRKDFGIVYPGKPDDLINDEVLLKLDIKAKR